MVFPFKGVAEKRSKNAAISMKQESAGSLSGIYTTKGCKIQILDRLIKKIYLSAPGC